MTCPWGQETVAITDFCELARPCAWVVQPIGTLSAAAFLLVAVGIAVLARHERLPALYLLTFAGAWMALGTAAQHATGTSWGMLLDHAGMQSVNVVMVLVGIRRWFGTRWQTLIVGGGLAWLLLVPLTGAFDEVRRALVVGGMIPCALIELRLWFRDGSQTRYGTWALGWVAFLVAVGATRSGTCPPRSVSGSGQLSTASSTRCPEPNDHPQRR